jgi:hypothetical protein
MDSRNETSGSHVMKRQAFRSILQSAVACTMYGAIALCDTLLSFPTTLVSEQALKNFDSSFQYVETSFKEFSVRSFQFKVRMPLLVLTSMEGGREGKRMRESLLAAEPCLPDGE